MLCQKLVEPVPSWPEINLEPYQSVSGGGDDGFRRQWVDGVVGARFIEQTIDRTRLGRRHSETLPGEGWVDQEGRGGKNPKWES